MQHQRTKSPRPDDEASDDRAQWKVRWRRYLNTRTAVAVVALISLVGGDVAAVVVAL